jgi:hypothetical protein
MFKALHPTETAGSGQSIVGEDLPSEKGYDGRESRFVRCSQCGHIVDTSKRQRATEGDGLVMPSTQLASAVTAGDTTITVDSTSGFDSNGTAYIFDCNSERDHDESFTYTGTTSTTFTGVSGVAYDHAVDCYVRGEEVAEGGCGFCGSYAYAEVT